MQRYKASKKGAAGRAHMLTMASVDTVDFQELRTSQACRKIHVNQHMRSIRLIKAKQKRDNTKSTLSIIVSYTYSACINTRSRKRTSQNKDGMVAHCHHKPPMHVVTTKSQPSSLERVLSSLVARFKGPDDYTGSLLESHFPRYLCFSIAD